MRPEDLHISEDGAGTFSHSVQVVEHLGADTLAHGTFGDDNTDMTVRLKGIQEIGQDEILPLNINPDNIHVFDRDTSKRL